MTGLNIFKILINGFERFKKIDRTKRWLVFIILAVNLTVFFPALFHVARSEQSNYLYEISDVEGLKDLVTFSYSYARTRLFAPGDTFLFRPLLYIFFAVQKWIFGYHFFFWQMTAILLHLWVAWQLLRVLTYIKSNWFAYLFVLNFSVLYISQEMVIWHHMTPIVFQMGLILMTFNHLLCYINSHQSEHFRIKWMVLYLTLASMIHEYALIVNFVFFVTLIIYRKKDLMLTQVSNSLNFRIFVNHFKHIGYLCLPPIIFLSTSIVDYLIRFGYPVIESHPIEFFKAVKYCFGMFFLSLITPILPGYLHIGFTKESTNRLTEDIANIMHVFNQGLVGGIGANLNFILLCSLMFWLCIVIFNLFSEKKSVKQVLYQGEEAPRVISLRAIALLGLILSCGYVAMIVLARLAPRGFEYINVNLFYLYPVILFNQIFLYFMFMTVISRASEVQTWIKSVFIFLILLSIVLNGYKSFWLNVMVQKDGEHNIQEMVLDIDSYCKFQKYSLGGLLYYSKGMNDLALEYLNKALKYYSGSGPIAKVRASVLYIQGDYQKAIEESTKALEIDPLSEEVYLMRALCYSHMGSDAAALKDFNKSLEYNPAQPGIYNNIGNIYNRQGQFALAIEFYEQAIKIEPNLIASYYNRGVANLNLQKYDLAIKDFVKVLSIDPQYQKAYIQKGIAYYLTGRHEEALKDYDQVLKTLPAEGFVYFKKSEVYKALGNKKLALENIAKAQQLNYLVGAAYIKQVNDMKE